jgi:hypothetical protein
MTSFRQIEANRRNALKSTGPQTAEGKERSRCNAVRHGLTAETVIRALEDSEDYEAFETAVTADYDAQTAVEREIVLRLASLLWRLRRATAMGTGLLAIAAEHAREVPQLSPDSAPVIAGRFGRNRREKDSMDLLLDLTHRRVAFSEAAPISDDPAGNLSRCFLRLADMPNYPLDRLSRYEAALWRQAGQILFTLDALGRRKPRHRSVFLQMR